MRIVTAPKKGESRNLTLILAICNRSDYELDGKKATRMKAIAHVTACDGIVSDIQDIVFNSANDKRIYIPSDKIEVSSLPDLNKGVFTFASVTEADDKELENGDVIHYDAKRYDYHAVVEKIIY
jgi:hypothetical protein